MSTTRRTVLIAISRLAVAAALGSAARAAQPQVATDLATLASVAYDILPFAELPPELYVKAAQRLLDLQDKEVVAGLAKLRDAAHGRAWKDVPDVERVAVLSSLQGSAFFRLLRTNTLQVVLRDPATFALVGYGGSSMQYGGYIGRGFNDIKWLPAASGK